MNIAVDIGNTRLKCGIFLPNGTIKVYLLPNPTKKDRPYRCSLRRRFLRWDMLPHYAEVLAENYPEPITWKVARTGSFPWQDLREKMLDIVKKRPRDTIQFLTRNRIPLKINADSPGKIGIDRLLAAFAAVTKYGDAPMLIVDAGSAITVDVVQYRTFCGGAILPGLVAQSEMYPKISEKLPLVPISDSFLTNSPVYPGKNTKAAIRNGLYWGTIGAIRQFYEMFSQTDNTRLILTGGDAKYLFFGLISVIPRHTKCHNTLVLRRETLVLEGINLCGEE